MRKVIIFISILFLSYINVVAVAAEDKCYNLNLNYDAGKIELKRVTVEPCPGFRVIEPKTGYKAVITSFTEEVLHSITFEIPLTIAVEEIDPETGELISREIQLEKTAAFLRTPYFNNGKTIDIYDQNGTKILKVNIAHFADICGNGVCESGGGETIQNCPQDCLSPEALEIKKAVEEEAVAVAARKKLSYIFSGIGALFAFGIAIYFYRRKM